MLEGSRTLLLGSNSRAPFRGLDGLFYDKNFCGHPRLLSSKQGSDVRFIVEECDFHDRWVFSGFGKTRLTSARCSSTVSLKLQNIGIRMDGRHIGILMREDLETRTCIRSSSMATRWCVCFLRLAVGTSPY